MTNPRSLENEDAEMIVLGAMIATPRLCETMHSKLESADFTGHHRPQLFNTLIDLHAAGIPIDDPIVLMDRLERLGRIEKVGGEGMIEEALARRVDNVDHCIESVRDLSRRRRIVSLCQDAIGRVYQGGVDCSADDIAERLRASVLSINSATGDDEISTIQEIVSDCLDRAERAAAGDADVQGIATSVSPIDLKTGGLFPGLTVIAARPSMGKTALGWQILSSAAREGFPAFFVSLEMSEQQIGDRTIAGSTGVNSMLLRSGKIGDESLSSLRSFARTDLAELPLHVWRPKQTQTIERIAAMTRLHISRHGSRIVAIDHLLKIAPTDRREVRHEQIAHIVSAAKNLSTELEIPVLLLTQAKRKDQTAKDKAPTLDELYGSSMIEAEADDVWLIHRPDRDAEFGSIKLAKFRNGPVQTVDVSFDPVRTEFGSPNQFAEFAEFS